MPPRSCDLLIDGVLILTLGADDRIITGGAVAVVGDRIAALGPSREIATHWAAERTIDGRFDGDAIVAEAQAVAERLWSRHGTRPVTLEARE